MRQAAFVRAAKLYRSLRKSGVTIRKPVDCMIASVAIEHHIRLLHNDRDFDYIARHSKPRVCDGRGRQSLPSDGEKPRPVKSSFCRKQQDIWLSEPMDAVSFYFSLRGMLLSEGHSESRNPSGEEVTGAEHDWWLKGAVRHRIKLPFVRGETGRSDTSSFSCKGSSWTS